MGIILVEKAIVDDKLRIRSCTIEDVDLQDENIINITVALDTKSLIYNKSVINIWQLNGSEQSDASNQSMDSKLRRVHSCKWAATLLKLRQIRHCNLLFFQKVRKVTSKHPFLCTNVYLIATSIIPELHVLSVFNILKDVKRKIQQQLKQQRQ